MGSEIVERLDSVRGVDDITPWEGLLLEVRRSGYRVRWVEQELNAAVEEEARIARETTELDPAPLTAARKAVTRWLRESRMERRHLTVVSKAAIDAGVAKVMVEQAQLDGQILARVWARGLAALQLTDEQKQLAGKALRLALETELAERQEKTRDRRRAEEAERAVQLDLDAETIEGELAEPERGTDGLSDVPEAESAEPAEPTGPPAGDDGHRQHPSNPGAVFGQLDDWAGGEGDGSPAGDDPVDPADPADPES